MVPERQNIAISTNDGVQIAEILCRRANEIASFKTSLNDNILGSVDLALCREIERLRKLADKVKPEPKESEDDE